MAVRFDLAPITVVEIRGWEPSRKKKINETLLFLSL